MAGDACKIIAILEIFSSIVAVCTAIYLFTIGVGGLYSPDFGGSYSVAVVYLSFGGAVSVFGILDLVFGILLLQGVKRESAGLLTAWFVKAVICMILSFPFGTIYYGILSYFVLKQREEYKQMSRL